MGVTLTQYHDMVTLDSKGFINILVIEYSGKMQIELDIEVKKVKMTDKRIHIYFNRETQINDALFYYSGWINIKKATAYTANGKKPVSKILSDETWKNLSLPYSEEYYYWNEKEYQADAGNPKTVGWALTTI